MFITCVSCQAKIKVGERRAQSGGSIACPQCKASIDIPAPQTATQPSGASASASPPPVPAVAAADPVAIRVGVPPAPVKTGSRGLLITLVCVLSVVVVAGVGLGAWALGKSSQAEPARPGPGVTGPSVTGLKAPPENPRARTRKADDEHKANEQRRKKIEKEIESLKDKRDGLAGENRELKLKKDELEEKIRKLVGDETSLKRWQHVDFVMVNPHNFAVGIKIGQEGKFQVELKAEQHEAVRAIAVARNSGIPRIARDKPLTRKLHTSVDAGEPVPAQLSESIREYWREHKFLPPGLKDFVVFRDVSTNAYRVGYFKTIEGDNLHFYPLGSKAEVVPKRRIIPGTARLASAEKIEAALGDGDFLDYCLLMVAQKIASPTGRQGHVCLYVDTKVDVPEVEVVGQRFHEFTLRLGGLSFRAGGARNLTRGKPYRPLRMAARYLEDEVYKKLTRMGLPVIDRKYLQTLQQEQDRAEAAGRQPEYYGNRLCASHVLNVYIKPGINGGDYHLAVRLLDLQTDDRWTEAGDRVLKPAPPASQFLLHSGMPSMIELKPKAIKGFVGAEQPPVIPPDRTVKKPSGQYLVYTEESTASNTVRYRTLFSNKVREVPKASVEKVTPVGTVKDVPREHLLRYVLWDIARHTLPLAGRVSRIDNDQVTITLGKAAGLKPGDKLRVLRIIRVGGKQEEVLLPTELTVREVYKDATLAIVEKSGLESYWPDMVELSTNDIVVAPAGRSRSVTIPPPKLIPPSPRVYKELQLGVRAKGNIFRGQANRHRVLLANLLAGGIRRLHVRNVIGEAGTTHVVSSTIQRRSSTSYNVVMRIKPTKSDQLIHEIRFTVFKNRIEQR